MHKTLKSLDLFSGIGGFALGFHWAGIETAAFCEIELYPRKVLAKNFPNVPIHRDIKELNGYDYKEIDIITGGFPCQPHSLAGKRRASEDERDLWGEMLRIICEARPKWVVAENVPGLLSSESGRYFGRVLRDLAQEGYCVQWFSLSASAVGAWHKRERIWIVAHLGSPRRQRSLQKAIQRQSRIPWGKNGRRIESWPRMSSISSPRICRASDGIPRRVDRTKGCGNAVVPQIPYLIGRAIMKAENE